MLRSKTEAQQPHKIGLYVRVSTEEQASNPEGSIKSQEQRLRSHIGFKNLESPFGEVVSTFVDRARSGKDTNRPELQRLLTAIRKGDVTMVLVTELSRLSRSIKDFCDIWQLMKSHNCEFQSLREQFDTTSAAGEMVLYTIANIAQFERRQISERVSANLQARAERGLHNGGSIPFGYRMHPELSGRLVPEEEEAKIVRELFDTFLREGSLAATGKSLNQRGIRFTPTSKAKGSRTKLGIFTVSAMHWLLTNKSYVGIRSFKVRGEKREVKAAWDGIVNQETFDAAQALLKKNHRRLKKRLPNRYPFILSGLCVCGQCSDHMPGKSAHGNGGKYSYYEHGWSTTRQACLTKKVFTCKPHRVSAKKLEPAVWEEVTKLLTEPSMAESLIDEAKKIHAEKTNAHEVDRTADKVKGIERQIEAVAEHLTKIPTDVSPEPIFRQMARLESLKNETKSQLEELRLSNTNRDCPVELKDYKELLKGLNAAGANADDEDIKTKIVQRLIHKVEIFPDGFDLHYYIGAQQFLAPAELSRLGPFYLPKFGSKTVDRSGPTWNRTKN